MNGKIKELRITRCLNATTVAKKMGVSRQWYDYLEKKADFRRMSQSTIRGLAEAIGVNVYDLSDVSDYLLVEPKNEEELRTLLQKIEERYHG